jgi:hypothetical protein
MGGTYIILGGGSGITLGLGAARDVTPVLVLLLLFLFATSKHGEHGRRGDGLLLSRSSLSSN